MEPVSAAIIAGVVAGVATGTTKVVEQAAVDAYKALMTALGKKSGSNSDVVKAVERLENKPDSEGQKAVVAEEIKAAKVHEDAELIAAAKRLLAELEKTPKGKQAVTNIFVTTARDIAQVGHNNNHIGDNNYFSSRSGDNK